MGNLTNKAFDTQLALLESKVEAIEYILKPRQYNASVALGVISDLLSATDALACMQDSAYTLEGKGDNFCAFKERRDALLVRINELNDTYLKKKD